jgi:hypothetical protein
VSFRRRACRLGIALSVASLALAGAAAAAVSTRGDVAPPQITLLTPANESTVASDASLTTYPAFTWRIDWPQPPTSGVVVYSFKLATDASMTQNVTVENQTCPFDNLDCFTSITPHMVYSGTYYWEVSVVSPVQATSRVSIFKGRKPVDKTPPRVKARPGSAVRGKTAFFSVRVSDNSGEVRMQHVLSYEGHPIVGGSFGFTQVSWSRTEEFWTKQPLPRSLPAGVYRSCLTAWDRAGNSARSCASYRVR